MAKSPRTTRTPAAPKASNPKTPRKTRAANSGSESSHRPEHDAIARRAYEIYQERGGEHGAHVDDWLQAEREIRARRSDGH